MRTVYQNPNLHVAILSNRELPERDFDVGAYIPKYAKDGKTLKACIAEALSNWKEALVLPLLKKLGLDIIFKNFRPVCNLMFISKLTEKAVSIQINDYLVDNGLYASAQSFYRENHSTETALLKVKNDILLNMNKQHVTLLARPLIL